MKNRRSIIISLVTVIILGVLLAETSKYQHRGQAAFDETSGVTSRENNSTSKDTPRDILSQTANALPPLGDPGLSYRYVKTFGESTLPYPVDEDHLNGPSGLFIDSGDNLYVSEYRGHRVLKFDSFDEHQLTLGEVGQPWHHDEYLARPIEIALDGDGDTWVLIDPALKEFDSAGNLLQIFPKEDPWISGDENDRFDNPWGLAFDSSGRMYISDNLNHRIQVYSFDIQGTPIYSTTIGLSGTPTDTNSGFNQPRRIAFDSSDRLYVMDYRNYRVQRCAYTSGWACTTFFGETGVYGEDLNHLGRARGITIDGADTIYITDNSNYRVLKCNLAGSCVVFAGESSVSGTDNAHFMWPEDVAVDSNDNVFISDSESHRIQKFNSSGGYVDTLGVTGVPYMVDNSRLNGPWGVMVAGDGSIFLTEFYGHRLIKLDAAGTQQWTVGQAGIYGDDDTHFGDYAGGIEGNPAVDAAGNVYVPDTSNNRVQIFDANGNYLSTLGQWGHGDYEFSCPTSVTINPVNDEILVVDQCNHRVQVYSSNLVYQTTIGVTEIAGSDDLHFYSPAGAVVDNHGNVFVADVDNFRVQKCVPVNSTYSCSTFVGETGISGNDFSHVIAEDVAIDKFGRVYVADSWNNRVQIFNADGEYLTTIGGAWGSFSSRFVWVTGVAVDQQGNVYISDVDNHRIQKFSPYVPGWKQININGFGSPYYQWPGGLAEYNDELYAGIYNEDASAQMKRMSADGSWETIFADGFGDPNNVLVSYLVDFNSRLYAGTWNVNVSGGSNGGQIWRSVTGNAGDWTNVASGGFGNVNNEEMTRLTVFNNQLYAATWNESSGGELWRSSSGDFGSWAAVITGGSGNSNNQAFLHSAVHNGFLYIGARNLESGTEVWRSATGDSGTWIQVNTDGFGDSDNWSAALESFQGYLYAATYNYTDSDDPGLEIWRCQICSGGDWEQLSVPKGLGDTNNRALRAMQVIGDQLYGVTINFPTGIEVWRTGNGTDWIKIGPDGLGDSNNQGMYWDNSITAFNDSLIIASSNTANGVEVWQLLKIIYLPAISR